jgi:hypothetical protein
MKSESYESEPITVSQEPQTLPYFKQNARGAGRTGKARVRDQRNREGTRGSRLSLGGLRFQPLEEFSR